MLAVGRLLAFVLVTLLLTPVQLVMCRLPGRAPFWITKFYHRLCCRLFGIRRIVRGRRKLPKGMPRLIVANHLSYLDITVLGSLLPASFIAKSEIAKWPLFGLLAKLQKSLFVKRSSEQTAKQLHDMRARFHNGDTLILFAEGTSGDGTRLLPFKSSLFGIINRLDDQPLVVQPVVISYVACNGIPVGRNELPHLAWYGDMSILSHGWNMLKIGRIQVLIDFLDPMTVHASDNRKRISEQCFEVMRQTYEQNMRSWSAVDGIPRRPRSLRQRLSRKPMAAIAATPAAPASTASATKVPSPDNQAVA